MDERKFLYRTLDNPLRVLFWSVDEFLVMVAPLFLSLCLGSLLCIVAGLLIKPIYSKLKKKFPHRTFRHRLYWYLPAGALGGIKYLPPSYHRELLL